MKQKEIYKCEKCGKVIEILNVGNPETICCGQPMKLMEEKTADYAKEKHVPFVEIKGNKVTVSVGIKANMAHPMTKEHWIMWIEVICKNGCYKRKFLNPGDEPKATFEIADPKSVLMAREYCNIHGLWKSK